MVSPSLVVVPPSPLHPAHSSASARPSPTTTTTSSSAPPTPDLPAMEVQSPRKSSETVDRIFSMYGSPGSEWAVGSPEEPTVFNGVLPPSTRHRLSVFPSQDRSTSNEPLYSEELAAPAEGAYILISRPEKASDFQHSFVDSQRSSGPIYTLTGHESVLAPLNEPPSPPRTLTPARSRPPSAFPADPHSRPPSQYTAPHMHPPSSQPLDDRLSRSSTHLASRPHTPGSRRSSQHRKSTPHPNGDEEKILHSPPSASSTPRSLTPGRADLLSPKPQPLSPLPARRSVSQCTAGSSAQSHGPSEGEDHESFFVRNTYAQLDSSGVKGDGYEEGVERTRARVGGSRASELRARDAVADGTEKTRDLNPEEVRLLSSLDRYGFFTTPSHDRLVLLPAAPFRKPLSRVTADIPGGTAQATSVSKIPTPPIHPKELSRIAKWERMLQPLVRDPGGNIELWAVDSSKERKLRERVYKGIPDRWRSAAWDMLMSRLARTDQRTMRQMRETYRDGLDKPSTFDIQIDLDVPRTISGHVMFRTRYGMGQRSLFHVLHSFSLRCPDCGYVQGMGPIAATLLCYLDPERVYASLVRLHDVYEMHTIFSPGFPGLLESIYVQERITEALMPDVYSAFKRHMVGTTSYATKWYITLFANSVPFHTQLRMWDVFLLEGSDVFVVIALAIIWAYRDHITTTSASFETILSLLSSFFIPEDDDAFLLWIGKVLDDAKLRTNMKNWRAEWKGLVESGKSGDALL